MKDEDRKTEDVNQDPLSRYHESEARMRARTKKARGSADGNRDEPYSHQVTDGSPLSDEEVRLAISQPPTLSERRRIKDAAGVLKRAHPELSALRTQEDWERASELVEEEYRNGQFLIDNLGADRYVEPKIGMTLLV